LGGLLLTTLSLVLGLSGWPIASLWLYLMASAMLIVLGFRLIIYWFLLRAQ
jgi:hypothetical protein